MNKETITQELNIKSNKKINKIFLGIFLAIAIIALLMKLVDEVLMDLGLMDGEFHFNYWKDDKFIAKMIADDNKAGLQMIARHPNFFWHLTQFTWITTLVIIVIMTLRFFKYDQEDLPRWIKWVMTQRTISLIAMYDMVVGSVFWIGMAGSFMENFNPDLFWSEMIITIIVHAIIPLMTLSYSLIYLLNDEKASILKEGFVLKGMIYPLVYGGYYIIISQVWGDPYGISNLNEDFTGEIWKLPALMFAIYVLLGIMLLSHNALLLKYNKHYNPRKDYEILMRKQHKIEKLQRKIIRKNKK